MEEEPREATCANVDCRVAETNQCVEGHELPSCPYFGRQPSAADDDDEDEVEDEDEGDIEVQDGAYEAVLLPSADSLSIERAENVLRSGHCRVISIIGPSDSGKTSLIASLYDKFQEGGVNGIEFSRSCTLHAFEQTCHDARTASRRGVPHIARTPLGEVRFYHMELGGGGAGGQIRLLLADRAGEEYLAVADDISVARDLAEVRRADALTVLVDGARLIDSGKRHNLRSDILMILQGLHEGDGLRSGSRLALVLTKMDVVQGHAHEARARRDFAGVQTDVQRLFGTIFSEIAVFHVAASPETDVTPRGTGVGDLLSFWLGPPPAGTAALSSTAPLTRAFHEIRPLGKSEEMADG